MKRNIVIDMPEGHDMNAGDVLLVPTIVDPKKMTAKDKPYRVVASAAKALTICPMSPLEFLLAKAKVANHGR